MPFHAVKVLSQRVTLGVAAVAVSAGLALAQTELTVYTAVEPDDLAKYAAAFNQDHPEITIRWVRDSTGIITARLLAEKDNPQADVVWGLAATSLMLLKDADMLEPYAPVGVEALDPRFVDSDTPPSWTGMDAWVAALCFNTAEAARHNLPAPTSWQDLTNPVYAGQIVMPNPASSGTGYLDVSSWLQLFGEEQGWAFMDGLHANIAQYTHSGSKPCNMAASGEVAIGVSFAFRAARLKSQGAPLEVILPSEGIGWDMEAAAIVRGTSKLDAAQTLVNWTVTEQANRLYNEGYAVVAYPGIAQPVENFPENVVEAMIDNDFEWAAVNRERILAEWTRRYDAKSEAR